MDIKDLNVKDFLGFVEIMMEKFLSSDQFLC